MEIFNVLHRLPTLKGAREYFLVICVRLAVLTPVKGVSLLKIPAEKALKKVYVYVFCLVGGGNVVYKCKLSK